MLDVYWCMQETQMAPQKSAKIQMPILKMSMQWLRKIPA